MHQELMSDTKIMTQTQNGTPLEISIIVMKILRRRRTKKTQNGTRLEHPNILNNKIAFYQQHHPILGDVKPQILALL